jgi:hypothetical protein
MKGSLRGRLAGRRRVPWQVQGYMREKGAIGNRLRRAIGQAGPFSAIGVASVTPRIRMLALRQRGTRQPALPPAVRPVRRTSLTLPGAQCRQSEAEHPTLRLRTRHAGEAFAQKNEVDRKRHYHRFSAESLQAPGDRKGTRRVDDLGFLATFGESGQGAESERDPATRQKAARSLERARCARLLHQKWPRTRFNCK